MSSVNIEQPPEVITPGISPWRFSPAVGPPLRVGLLLDSTELTRFYGRIVEDIQASNFAKIELLVIKAARPAASKHGGGSKLSSIRRRLFDSKLRQRTLYSLYLELDRRMKPRNHPLDKSDGANPLAGIESITVEPIGSKFVHRFPEETLEQIRARKLDVLIRFGFNILHGDILKAARYGVWSYHHGDNDFYRGGPSHFWELQEESPLSGVILQVLTEELDAGLVLCKSLFTTQKTISMSVNRYAPYWGSADFVIRKLNELHQFGWEHLKKNAVPAVPYQGKRKLYRLPTNTDMVRWLGPVFIKKAMGYPFRRPIVPHWQIGVRVQHKPLFEDHGLEGFRWIEAEKGHFWADPFGFEHDGKNWVFFEDYSYVTKRGSIACAELGADGSLLRPVPCLESANRHYSYPLVFRSGSDIFMVPESYDSNRVELYKCQEFPGKWESVHTFFNGQFVDTTIWQHDGLWWLLTTRSEPDPRASSLLLMFAESLTGPWRFHPANPISTDARNNRGAGRILQAGGRLIRPSQSSCPTYGYSFSLNEITKLTPSEYQEHALVTVTPEFWKGFCAVHTYNRVGNIELIDGARWASLKDLVPQGR